MKAQNKTEANACEVPPVSGRASFADTILNPMLNAAIDELSDDSDTEMNDYTLEKGYERLLRSMRPEDPLIKPYTEDDFAKQMCFRHVTRWLIEVLPAPISIPLRKLRTWYSSMVMRSRRDDWFGKATKVFNLVCGVISLLFHALYLISFSWQIILTTMHHLVLYSDHFWTYLLDDRSSPGI